MHELHEIELTKLLILSELSQCGRSKCFKWFSSSSLKWTLKESSDDDFWGGMGSSCPCPLLCTLTKTSGISRPATTSGPATEKTIHQLFSQLVTTSALSSGEIRWDRRNYYYGPNGNSPTDSMGAQLQFMRHVILFVRICTDLLGWDQESIWGRFDADITIIKAT